MANITKNVDLEEPADDAGPSTQVMRKFPYCNSLSSTDMYTRNRDVGNLGSNIGVQHGSAVMAGSQSTQSQRTTSLLPDPRLSSPSSTGRVLTDFGILYNIDVNMNNNTINVSHNIVSQNETGSLTAGLTYNGSGCSQLTGGKILARQ